MDLLSILPEFSTKSYTHILPPLERKHITTADLITLDTLEIAKRAHVPPADVRRLSADVIAALHGSLGIRTSSQEEKQEGGKEGGDNARNENGRPATNRIDLSQWNTISTLDPTLDELLGGGIPTGYLTEITGESGSGKTQFLLNLLLTAQLPPPKGIGRKAIYISTEAPLPTPRLTQLLQNHPYLSNISLKDSAPSLGNVLSITAVDLETQDHILNYQLPVAVSRFNVGLVVIDSITANYRAEHASNSIQGLSVRSGELAKLGQMLRNLAASENVAIVVVNQVSDRFDFFEGQQQQQQQQQHQQGRFRPLALRESGKSPVPRNRVGDTGGAHHLPSSSPAPPSSSQLIEDDSFDGAYIIGHPVRNETLTLAHQERFFTGWGDNPDYLMSSEARKTPALGLVWSTQIACRIVLKKEDEVVPMLDTARIASTPSFQPVQAPVNSDITTARNIPPSLSLSSSSSSSSFSPFSSPSKNPTVDKNGDNKTAETAQPSPPPPPPPIQSQPSSQTTERITTKRRMKLVFAPWASGVVVEQKQNSNSNDRNQDEVEFEIWKGGIRSIVRE